LHGGISDVAKASHISGVAVGTEGNAARSFAGIVGYGKLPINAIDDSLS
jgi:hypothetical protein